LSERLGRPFVIENRPGAGTNIATEAVVRSPPDGYTLLQVNAPAAINATLYDKLNFVVLRDIAPVASITRTGYVLAVHPSFPAKTVPEFISLSDFSKWRRHSRSVLRYANAYSSFLQTQREYSC
ncbi:MAG: tripartite tricarboxylate transporter substrate-binding protein, partial [Devosia sp.]|uniref:tripartite tricarboxylate transporter substrate-binding protein n=1 Tax=Devosia sp. TaxID=1871048 RepID=UPI0033973EF5